MNNLLSYCGLVDARIRASNKDLPVHMYIIGFLFHTSSTMELDNQKMEWKVLEFRLWKFKYNFVKGFDHIVV